MVSLGSLLVANLWQVDVKIGQACLIVLFPFSDLKLSLLLFRCFQKCILIPQAAVLMNLAVFSVYRSL
jgi:hypothetical protein